MKLRRIFVDLDDVLNVFTMSALAEAGCPVEPYDYHLYDPEWGYDIVRALCELNPEFCLTNKGFWEELSYDFWANIQLSPEAPWLLSLCASLVGKENVFIATSVSEKVGKDVASAKVEWIFKNMPKWIHNQFFIGTCKYCFASKDSLLIDDSEKNVYEFCKHGGRSILVPRPWNRLYNVDTTSFILCELARVK